MKEQVSSVILKALDTLAKKLEERPPTDQDVKLFEVLFQEARGIDPSLAIGKLQAQQLRRAAP